MLHAKVNDKKVEQATHERRKNEEISLLQWSVLHELIDPKLAGASTVKEEGIFWSERDGSAMVGDAFVLKVFRE